MGRTVQRFRDHEDDEWDRKRQRHSKHPKHSRNPRGQGMRVINNESEQEDIDDFGTVYDEHTSTLR